MPCSQKTHRRADSGFGLPESPGRSLITRSAPTQRAGQAFSHAHSDAFPSCPTLLPVARGLPDIPNKWTLDHDGSPTEAPRGPCRLREAGDLELPESRQSRSPPGYGDSGNSQDCLPPASPRPEYFPSMADRGPPAIPRSSRQRSARSMNQVAERECELSRRFAAHDRSLRAEVYQRQREDFIVAAAAGARTIPVVHRGREGELVLRGAAGPGDRNRARDVARDRAWSFREQVLGGQEGVEQLERSAMVRQRRERRLALVDERQQQRSSVVAPATRATGAAAGGNEGQSTAIPNGSGIGSRYNFSRRRSG